MPTPTTGNHTRTLTLTEVGRVRAILARLEARWPELSAAQQLEALALLGELAQVYRSRTGLQSAM
jgi:hypothetical protein